MTDWPGADGSGVSERTAVIVEAGFTVWPPPLRWARSAGSWRRRGTSRAGGAHPPPGSAASTSRPATVPRHTAELSSSVTSTEPVGVPAPGAFAVTV